MSVPQLQLDDRDFQSLVDEARTRIARTCPAWNEHNVSDPGITLIELFAWMTDLLVYRVNRIPEKVRIALLELLGVQLEAAEVATADLRFRLSAPALARVEVAAGAAEVATAHAPQGGPVVFRTVEPLVVPPLRLEALRLTRAGEVRELAGRDDSARLAPSESPGLASPSRPDDGLYLGFGAPLSGLVVAIAVVAAPARGTGVAPDAPPWSWEVAQADGSWLPATVLSDETGGFNYGSGTVELQLPRDAPATAGVGGADGARLRWLRCRLHAQDPEPAAGGYTHAPALSQVRVAALGALVRAQHADEVEGELLGYSDGSPGQVFQLRRRPALALGPDDGLELLDPDTKAWVRWSVRSSFADSGPQDRHYCFDPVAGEVSLGPAIREAGGWVQHGAIPPAGVALRMRRYRCGGGVRGNVEAGALSVLRRALPGIASVANPAPARGGADPETFAEAQRSAAVELRTRSRAVTAGDYAVLARRASRAVARVRCVEPTPGEPVAVRVLPTVAQPGGRIAAADLQPSDELLDEVARYLDARRLLGTSVHVTPMALRGVTVVAEVTAEPEAERRDVERDVESALYGYVNPYVGGNLAGAGEGWEFGRALGVGELEVLVRAVPGVLDVPLLRLYATDLASGRPDGRPAAGQLEIGADELVASARHRVRVLEPAAR